jgi:hypothetical protein
MLAVIVAVAAALRSKVRPRVDLTAEIFALRHPLTVLRRRAPERHLGRSDPFVWVFLSRLWTGWRDAVQIVTPDTVVRWHRQGFARYWRWRSRPRHPGRPHVHPLWLCWAGLGPPRSDKGCCVGLTRRTARETPPVGPMIESRARRRLAGARAQDARPHAVQADPTALL